MPVSATEIHHSEAGKNVNLQKHHARIGWCLRVRINVGKSTGFSAAAIVCEGCIVVAVDLLVVRGDGGVARRSICSEPSGVTRGRRSVRVSIGVSICSVTLSGRDRGVDRGLLGRRAAPEGCTLLERRLAPRNCERARDAGRVAIGYVGVDRSNGGILVDNVEQVVSVDIVHTSSRGGEVVGFMN